MEFSLSGSISTKYTLISELYKTQSVKNFKLKFKVKDSLQSIQAFQYHKKKEDKKM